MTVYLTVRYRIVCKLHKTDNIFGGDKIVIKFNGNISWGGDKIERERNAIKLALNLTLIMSFLSLLLEVISKPITLLEHNLSCYLCKRRHLLRFIFLLSESEPLK